jgi:hypothetical protein
LSQALINFIAKLSDLPNNSLKTSIVGSLAKLSTDAFPAGQDGWDLLEIYPDGTSKVYVYCQSQWRELK